MDNRLSDAVTSLKTSKAQSLSYYDATQNLLKQGFTQEEIEQASYQFPYSEITQPDSNNVSSDPSLDQAFAEGVVHEEAIDNAKQELHQDVAKGFLGGKSIVGSYYGNRAVGDYAALKDLEKNGQTDPINQNISSQGGKRVFQRNRAIRYYALISLAPLILLAPSCLGLVMNLPIIIKDLLHNHDATTAGSIGLYLWSAGGYLAYVCIAALLFFARKESTIIKSIYAIMAVDAALFVIFAALFKSPAFLVFGLITMIPGFFISKRVGLLLQLS